MADFMSFDNNLIPSNAPCLPYDICGVTTGIGVFDSLSVISGTPQLARAHYARLCHDTDMVIGIDLKQHLSFDDWGARLQTLMTQNNMDSIPFSCLRTSIFGGKVSSVLAPAENIHILITIREVPNPTTLPPIKCIIVDQFPRIAGCDLENCKRLDYTRSYAARREAEMQGAEEAILTNTNGNIACGTTSNLFIEENGTLITPPLSEGVLAGVTRRDILDKQKAKEEIITPERLMNADQIYLTNSLMSLRRVTFLHKM